MSGNTEIIVLQMSKRCRTIVMNSYRIKVAAVQLGLVMQRCMNVVPTPKSLKNFNSDRERCRGLQP